MSQEVKERNFSFRLLFRTLLKNETNEKEIDISDIEKAESGRISELLASSNNDNAISDKKGKGFVETREIDIQKANEDAKKVKRVKELRKLEQQDKEQQIGQ